MPPEIAALDYAALGLMSGLEIHQQLATKKKLYCRCPNMPSHGDAPHDAEFVRHMRPTLSEMGVYDGTALMEFKTQKNVHYLLYRDNTCTYDMDDTPPFPINDEALMIAIRASLMLGCSVVDEVHVSRKQYLDGSIPTGFQRTAIISSEGSVAVGARRIRIAWTTLEEDASREWKDEGHEIWFRVDRLGTPLIEVITHPDCQTPREVAETARAIALCTRASGGMRRGIGSVRQDVNVSIRGGTRVEIKGVPRIALIENLVAGEALRQKDLLDLAAELIAHGATAAEPGYEAKDAWQVVQRYEGPSAPPGLRQAQEQSGSRILAVRLPRWKGLLGRRVGVGRTFADEISGRLRVIACLDRLPNLLHSDDERPESLSPEFWLGARAACGASPEDGVVLVWGGSKDADTAAAEVLIRAREAFAGVPSETREVLPGSPWSTDFERILPGADRMYPDTDTPPTEIDDARIERARAGLAQHPDVRGEACAALGLSHEQTAEIVSSPRYDVFVRACRAGGATPGLAATIVTSWLTDLKRKGLDPARITDDMLFDGISLIASGQLLAAGFRGMLGVLSMDPLASPAALLLSLKLAPLADTEHDALARETERLHVGVGPSEREARVRFLIGRAVYKAKGRASGAILSRHFSAAPVPA